jgi:hypothetical protein
MNVTITFYIILAYVILIKYIIHTIYTLNHINAYSNSMQGVQIHCIMWFHATPSPTPPLRCFAGAVWTTRWPSGTGVVGHGVTPSDKYLDVLHGLVPHAAHVHEKCGVSTILDGTYNLARKIAGIVHLPITYMICTYTYHQRWPATWWNLMDTSNQKI